MREYEFSLRENTGQSKPVFSHILCSDRRIQKNCWLVYCQKAFEALSKYGTILMKLKSPVEKDELSTFKASMF